MTDEVRGSACPDDGGGHVCFPQRYAPETSYFIFDQKKSYCTAYVYITRWGEGEHHDERNITNGKGATSTPHSYHTCKMQWAGFLTR